MARLKPLIENNFSAILLISIAVGIFFKELQNVPENIVIVLISLMIFFSCTKISIQDLREIKKKLFILFYITRFIILPALSYYIALSLVPDYALGVLLVSLVPAGATSAALSNLLGGNTSLAFVITVLTSVSAPFTIPFFVDLIAGKDLNINTLEMFKTLFLMIFIPALVYFGLIKKKSSK